MVKDAPPATAAEGEIAVIVGISAVRVYDLFVVEGALIDAGVVAPVFEPALVTLMVAALLETEFPNKLEGTRAVNCEAFTKVVVNAVDPQFTVENPLTKFVPLTVSVILPEVIVSTLEVAGEILATVGTSNTFKVSVGQAVQLKFVVVLVAVSGIE